MFRFNLKRLKDLTIIQISKDLNDYERDKR